LQQAKDKKRLFEKPFHCRLTPYQLMAYIRQIGNLGVDGIPRIMRFVHINQFYIEFIEKVGENLQIGIQIIEGHFPQHPVGTAEIMAHVLPGPYARHIPAGVEHKLGRRRKLVVEILHFIALIAELGALFHKILNRVPGGVFQRQQQEKRTNKTIRDICAVMLANPVNEPDNLGILYLHLV
jgi:hypothetical protein